MDEKGEIYFAKDLSTPSNPRSVAIEKINLFLEPLKSRGGATMKSLRSYIIKTDLFLRIIALMKNIT